MMLLSPIPVAIPAASFPPEVLLACDAMTLTIDVPEAAAFEIDHSSVLTLRLNFRGRGHRSAAVWRHSRKGGLYLTEHAVGLLHPLQQGGWLLTTSRPQGGSAMRARGWHPRGVIPESSRLWTGPM